MELRHLRYFVAVAECGSLTEAASKILFTTQPSLSRQLKDLEDEVGVQLFLRTSRGVQLTESGRVFLEHAKLSLSQVRDGVDAARKAAKADRELFSIGFLTGQEVDWLPFVTRILSQELNNVELKVSSDFSPNVGNSLHQGKIDLGFCRVEPHLGVVYKPVMREPIVLVLRRDHHLARHESIEPSMLEGEDFIGCSEIPHVLGKVVDDYLAHYSVKVNIIHRLDNFTTGVSLAASTNAITMLPAYVIPLLSKSLTTRIFRGDAPYIDLVIGYRKDNKSLTLAKLLKNFDTLLQGGHEILHKHL